MAFSNCKSLESVKLSNSMFTISENTFLSCEALKEITINGNIKSIQQGAFYIILLS